MRHKLADSLVEIDEAATLDWYAQAGSWGCECGHCRNFLALARQGKLPAEVTALLDALNIPPEKATYVCQLYRYEDGDLYQLSYRIAGRILEEGSQTDSVRCSHETYPYGAPGFLEPHFDLEFFLKLPWVLDGNE